MPESPRAMNRTVVSLALVSLALASCAEGIRCGRGRYSEIHTQGRNERNAVRTGEGGPYCLEIAAEGVGSINVSVNSPNGGGSGGEGDVGDPLTGSGTGPIGGPGAAVTYAATILAPNFVDVCSQPGARRVLPSVDDGVAQVPEPDAPRIPFPVRYYDSVTQPPFTVASNGWLAFASNVQVGTLSGTVPSSTAPNLVAALYWTDLVTRGGVCYASTGVAPFRQFVVQWDDVTEYGGNGGAHLTFELIVREARPPLTNNVIDFVYRNLDGVTRSDRPGAGLENADGSQGTPVPGSLTAPRAVRFTPSH